MMTEELRIRMDIPGTKVPSVRPQLDVLKDCCALNLDPATVKPRDLIKVNYTLTCKYWGNVAQALSAVNVICANHPEVVKAADYKELKRGKMLLHEVLTRLDQLMKTVGRPK